jgi:hypothetical protein
MDRAGFSERFSRVIAAQVESGFLGREGSRRRRSAQHRDDHAISAARAKKEPFGVSQSH